MGKKSRKSRQKYSTWDTSRNGWDGWTLDKFIEECGFMEDGKPTGDTLLHTFAMDYVWRNHPISHYFLEPGIAEFCISSVKDVSPEYFGALPATKPFKWPGAAYMPVTIDNDGWWVAEKTDWVGGAFAIHFPISEWKNSLIVFPNVGIRAVKNRSNDDDLVPFHYVAGTDNSLVVLLPADGWKRGDYDTICEFVHGKGRPPSQYTAYSGLVENTHKLILGFSLYVDAFPDAVVEREGGVVALSQYNGRRRHVTRNSVMEKEVRSSVSPHWRRGHFRYLSSDRYKNAKGKTVFVRGTFVKGKAYDVLDDA